MRISLSHTIIQTPQPDDAGTITINATVVGYNSTFTASSFAEEFINDVHDECPSKEDLNYFLMESGINDGVTHCAMMDLIEHVEEVASSGSNNYSPGCALLVDLTIIPDLQIEEAARPARKLVVKSLPRKIYDKVGSTGEKYCAICLEEFNHGGRLVATLPCGHEFDDECIRTWFERSHSCPLCRNKLPCEDQ